MMSRGEEEEASAFSSDGWVGGNASSYSEREGRKEGGWVEGGIEDSSPFSPENSGPLVQHAVGEDDVFVKQGKVLRTHPPTHPPIYLVERLHGWMEENEAVRMRYCKLGWVWVGWVGERPTIHTDTDTLLPTHPPTRLPTYPGRYVVNLTHMVRLPVFWGFMGQVRPGWVGGWVSISLTVKRRRRRRR